MLSGSEESTMNMNKKIAMSNIIVIIGGDRAEKMSLMIILPPL
jgi:hypothetical protein